MTAPKLEILTPRQGQILAKIRAGIAETGTPPSMRMIGESMGLQRITIWGHVKALESKGFISKIADTNGPNQGRYFPTGIELIDRVEAMIRMAETLAALLQIPETQAMAHALSCLEKIPQIATIGESE